MQNSEEQRKTNRVRTRSAKTGDRTNQNKHGNNTRTRDAGKNGASTHDIETNGEHERHKSNFERKRKRRSTGGSFDTVNTNADRSKEEFRGLSTDDKLVKIFEMLQVSQNDTQYMKDKIKKSEKKIERLGEQQNTTSSKVKVLEYKSIDLEARSRRNNLVFREHPESYREDCEMVIADFLETYLDIDPSAIYVNRAHRVGQYKSDKIRPIIVNFVYYKDVEYILEKAYKLQGTTYGINRDYPREITNARSRMWTQYKDAKKIRSNKVSIAYPAKLIINKQVVRDEFPDWNDVINKSRAGDDIPSSDRGDRRRSDNNRDNNKQGNEKQGNSEAFRSNNIYEVLSNQSDESSASDTETETESEMVIEVSQSEEETETIDTYSQVMNTLQKQTVTNNESEVINEPVDLCTQYPSQTPPIVVHYRTPQNRDYETDLQGNPDSNAPLNVNNEPPPGPEKSTGACGGPSDTSQNSDKRD